jgi:hypothetical protein
MLTRDEELAQRLVITPTPPLTAAARHYLYTNLYALGGARPRGRSRAKWAGGLPGG